MLDLNRKCEKLPKQAREYDGSRYSVASTGRLWCGTLTRGDADALPELIAFEFLARG